MAERYERVRVGWHCAKVKGHAEVKIEKKQSRDERKNERKKERKKELTETPGKKQNVSPSYADT